jgi:hypothetical protein
MGVYAVAHFVQIVTSVLTCPALRHVDH